ncbi:hypothetical protein, partial [Leuconostoc pseudomesenteroides]|uniref:hypothetical protein n=1 Tax=Leuconostoc pseudomesenteroides TaxID=33968 RepID=UPI0021A3FAC2
VLHLVEQGVQVHLSFQLPSNLQLLERTKIEFFLTSKAIFFTYFFFLNYKYLINSKAKHRD